LSDLASADTVRIDKLCLQAAETAQHYSGVNLKVSKKCMTTYTKLPDDVKPMGSFACTMDAFNTWSLRKILQIPYTRHTSSMLLSSRLLAVVQFHFLLKQDGAPFLWLCADSSQDHHGATGALLDQQATGGDLKGIHVPPG